MLSLMSDAGLQVAAGAAIGIDVLPAGTSHAAHADKPRRNGAPPHGGRLAIHLGGDTKIVFTRGGRSGTEWAVVSCRRWAATPLPARRAAPTCGTAFPSRTARSCR